MPDKGKPGSRWFIAGHLAVAVGGAVGTLFQPSPSLRSALDEAHLAPVVYVWSVAFLIFGLAAVTARLNRRYRAETWAVDGTAGVVFLWALMLATTRSTSAVQLALVLLGLCLVLHGWAIYRRARVESSPRLFRDLVDEISSYEHPGDDETQEDQR